MQQRIASLISKGTEPQVLVFLIVLLGALHAGMSGVGLLVFFLYLGIVAGFVWMARLRFMSSLKTNWDVSDRPKRVRLLIFLVGFSIFLFVTMFLWQNRELIKLATGLLLWLIGFSFITLKTKISGHLGVATLFIGFLLGWFGWGWGLLFLFLPFIAWSRLVS